MTRQNAVERNVHRDALGRVRRPAKAGWTRYGWYLDPDNAKLVELRRLQSPKNIESKVAWAIQVAASAYESDGNDGLQACLPQFIVACILLPILVSAAEDSRLRIASKV